MHQTNFKYIWEGSSGFGMFQLFERCLSIHLPKPFPKFGFGLGFAYFLNINMSVNIYHKYIYIFFEEYIIFNLFQFYIFILTYLVFASLCLVEFLCSHMHRGLDKINKNWNELRVKMVPI